MKKTLVEHYVEDPKHMRLYQQERAIYEVTELLESLLEEAGVGRAQLARSSENPKVGLLSYSMAKRIRRFAPLLTHSRCLGKNTAPFTDRSGSAASARRQFLRVAILRKAGHS